MALKGHPGVLDDDPRASFAAHGFERPWTRLQLAYFVGSDDIAFTQP